MKNHLGNGSPGEIFESDFLVNLEHCHGIALAMARPVKYSSPTFS
jgi:hypothetical protein